MRGEAVSLGGLSGSFREVEPPYLSLEERPFMRRVIIGCTHASRRMVCLTRRTSSSLPRWTGRQASRARRDVRPSVCGQAEGEGASCSARHVCVVFVYRAAGPGRPGRLTTHAHSGVN